MDDRLDDRVDAVERAITDGHAADGLPDVARMERRLDDLEASVEDLDDRLADLEAAVQALRGFAGGVRAVDEEVERRANAAVARVERLEADLRERREGDAEPAEKRPGASGGDDGQAERDREGSDAAVERTHDPEYRLDRTESSVPSKVAGRSDATLAAKAAEAADAVDHPEAERPTESDGDSGSLADRVRRLL